MKYSNDNKFNDMIIQSLCYLYRECYLNRRDANTLLPVLENAIEDIKCNIVEGSYTVSTHTNDILKQFDFIKEFDKLSAEEQDKIIKQIDSINLLYQLWGESTSEQDLLN